MCALQGIVHDAVRLGVSVLPASKSIVSIQVLRALAALAVLTYHVPIELSSRLGLHDVVPRFLIGAAGVDLFFVISGFIIVYASEMLFGRWDAPYVFFVRRLVRIVPLYWACTGLIVAYWMIARVDFNSIDISFGAIIGSFLFLPYPRPSGGMMPVIMLGWTVNYEMFFYAAFAGVIFLSRRRTVLTVITLFVAIVMAGQVFKPLPPTITFWSDPIILEFCFGMLIAAAYREGMRLPRVAAIALILAGAFGYLASGLWSGYAGSRVIEWGMPATAIVAGSVLSNELPSWGLSKGRSRSLATHPTHFIWCIPSRSWHCAEYCYPGSIRAPPHGFMRWCCLWDRYSPPFSSTYFSRSRSHDGFRELSTSDAASGPSWSRRFPPQPQAGSPNVETIAVRLVGA